MFKINDIQNAFDRLFGMYDHQEYIDACDTYPEEKAHIDISELCDKYNRDVKYLFDYVIPLAPKGQSTKPGAALFDHRAAMIACVTDKPFESKLMRIEPRSELWLKEDLSFVHIDSVRVITIKNGNPTSAVEHRKVIKTVETAQDLFIDCCSLICFLDDVLLFASLLDQKDEG